jgi:uncharacterized protein
MTNSYEAEALDALAKKPWFEAGLRFKCTGCGECCTGTSGAVYLSASDVERLAEALKLPVDAFMSRYTQPSDGQIALIDNPSAPADCIFLSGKACSVYDARPTQCRAYPFWLINVLEPKDWAEAADFCEGIDHPDAPLVPASEVLQQCRAEVENEPLSQ